MKMLEGKALGFKELVFSLAGSRSASVQNRNTWATSCLCLGLLTLGATDGSVPESVMVHMRRLVDESGHLRFPITGVPESMVGYFLLDVASRTEDAKFLRAATEMADAVLSNLCRTPTGMLAYSAGDPAIAYVDTLGMVCPFLARYGFEVGFDKAHELAVEQLLEFVRYGLDPKTFLPFHGVDVTNALRCGIIGWTRGVGWALRGLVDSLEYMERTSREFAEASAAFERIVESLANYQQSSGCWSWVAPLPSRHTDTSGTAMIGFCIERGLALGFLKGAMAECSGRIMKGLLHHTSPDGVVGSSQAECKGLGLYPHEFGASPWAQGPALGFARLYRMRQLGHSVHK